MSRRPARIPGLFVVGTDTGVGKTTVSCGLLRLARRAHFRLIPHKPIETGCSPRPEDADRLRVAAAIPDLRLSGQRGICGMALQAPLAPSIAARLEGRRISLPTLLAHARRLARLGDGLLVEGAGGLLAPFGPGITAADLASHLDIDILLVAANRLGTINHTALAVGELRRRGLRLAGIVLVDLASKPTPDRPYNAHEIARVTGVRPLGVLRHCPSCTPDRLADATAADLDLTGLCDGRLVPPARAMRAGPR